MTISALFLDRDGVINVDFGYVSSFDRLVYCDGIFELCTTASQLGFLIIVVTNQSAIGRGFCSLADYYHFTSCYLRDFESNGTPIHAVYHCPFHPEAANSPYLLSSPDRKPLPGMLLKAIADFNINPSGSILVGDNDTDIAAARAAGINTTFLYRNTEILTSVAPTFVTSSLLEIATYLKDTYKPTVSHP